jgi:hypothetical protein
MNNNRKFLAGGSEFTRLKELWFSLDERTQDYWRQEFYSRNSQKSIREKLKKELEVDLTHDFQISRFRFWVADQDELDAEKERMLEDERRLIAEFGSSRTLDEIRDMVLKRSYARTLARSDFRLGLQTMRADYNERTLQLHRDKFEFDAAEVCLRKLPELKVISSNPELSDIEKIDRIRLELFGKVPVTSS